MLVKGLRRTAQLCLLAGVLFAAGPASGAEGSGEGWDVRARDLSLALEPTLVYSDALSAQARGIADAYDDPSARAEALLRHVAGAYAACKAEARPKARAPRGATAIHESGCGTPVERVIIAVALLRAAGLEAYLAVATCAPWPNAEAVSLAGRVLPIWRVPGGGFSLLPASTTEVGEFLPPPCPWGEWLPLAPAMARPRHIPVPDGPVTAMTIELSHEEAETMPAPDGRTPGLARLVEAVVPRLEQTTESGWPRHFALRERWPASGGYCRPLHVRVHNAGGALAATLIRDGDILKLAVDLRIVAPPRVPGARPHISSLLKALQTLRCRPIEEVI